jgi:hypothetical protein
MAEVTSSSLVGSTPKLFQVVQVNTEVKKRSRQVTTLNNYGSAYRVTVSSQFSSFCQTRHRIPPLLQRVSWPNGPVMMVLSEVRHISSDVFTEETHPRRQARASLAAIISLRRNRSLRGCDCYAFPRYNSEAVLKALSIDPGSSTGGAQPIGCCIWVDFYRWYLNRP